MLDLGAGFGALSLFCASLGAEVVAVDPNPQRMQVAIAIAERRGLSVSALVAQAQSLPVPDASFDLVLANNSLCFIVDKREERLALSEIHRVLRPGGWTVIRNPNRLHPRDQFTGIPLLPLLSPALAQRLAGARGRARSNVRMRTPGGAVRQLRRAGFERACWRPQPGRGLGARLAGYHHVIGRRSAGPGGRSVERHPTHALRPGAPQRSGPPAPAQGPAASHAPRLAAGLPEALTATAAYAWLRRHWEATLLASMALVFLWMRLIDMQIGFWDDEAATVVRYIDAGPAGIYSSSGYTPNDHVLYSLLAGWTSASWVTTSRLPDLDRLPGDRERHAALIWTRRRLGRATAPRARGAVADGACSALRDGPGPRLRAGAARHGAGVDRGIRDRGGGPRRCVPGGPRDRHRRGPRRARDDRHRHPSLSSPSCSRRETSSPVLKASAVGALGSR